MDELACFAPGMLALGSSGYGPDESQKFLKLAEEVVLIHEKWIWSSVAVYSLFALNSYFNFKLGLFIKDDESQKFLEFVGIVSFISRKLSYIFYGYYDLLFKFIFQL